MQQHKEVSKIITYRAYLPLRNISLGKTGAAFSGLALSTLAIWCHVVRFRDVQFRVFSASASSRLRLGPIFCSRFMFYSFVLILTVYI